MPIRTAIWKVAAQPEPLAESSLAKEQLLEAMIIAAPRLLSDVQEIGMFGNQNTVCKPTTPKWRSTVERLKERFPEFDR